MSKIDARRMLSTVPPIFDGQGYDGYCCAFHEHRCELSEECRLRGGTWVKLIPDDHPGVMEAKWAATRFTPFLVISSIQQLFCEVCLVRERIVNPRCRYWTRN